MDPAGKTTAAPPDPLVRLMLDGQARTRAELMNLSGHARSTLGPRLAELESQGWVRGTRSAVATGGRRPSTFSFNPANAAVLAVDVAAGHMLVAATDLAQNVLVEHRLDAPLDDEPDRAFDRLTDLIDSVMASPALPDVVGVGLGLSAPLNPENGRPWHPPRTLRWHDYDIAGRLARTLDVPVTVDRDTNLMAIGELTVDAAGADSLLFVSAGTWIGAAIVINGQVVRGTTGQVGHLGHIRGRWDDDEPCTCGHRGCLEAVASGSALLRHHAERYGVSTTSELISHARADDDELWNAIREAGRKIGSVIADYVTTLNPARIVLGGSLAAAGVELLNGVRESLYKDAFLMTTENLALGVSHAGNHAVILGASALASRRFLLSDSSGAVTVAR